MSDVAAPTPPPATEAGSGSLKDVLKYFLYLGTFGFGGPIALAGYMQRDLVEKRGWFKREQDELFPFFYSWDTPSEMEEFVDDDWSDFVGMEEATRRATRSAWAVADADSRVRVRVEIWIARWRKTKLNLEL